MLELSNVSLV